jgi:RNA polymerase sigma-70 factor, ECF subfamily
MLQPVESPRTWPVHELALAEAYAEGRRAWPKIALYHANFVAFCARVLGDDPHHDWARHAGDLYLCAACFAGNREATRILERDMLAPIGRAQFRKHKNRELLQETLQVLRTKLLVGPNPKISAYAARGTLSAWLGVAAARVMVDLQRSHKNHTSLRSDLNAAGSVNDDPAASVVRNRYLASFSLALKSAIVDASELDRQLLESCIDGSSIDHLARVYSIHRATAARWLERARHRIFDSLRQQLMSQHGLSHEDFDSIARDLYRHLDGTLVSLRDEREPRSGLHIIARRRPARSRAAQPTCLHNRGSQGTGPLPAAPLPRPMSLERGQPPIN